MQNDELQNLLPVRKFLGLVPRTSFSLIASIRNTAAAAGIEPLSLGSAARRLSL